MLALILACVLGGNETNIDLVSYKTSSQQWTFIESEPQQTEVVAEGGYLAGSCNCPMCLGLRAKRTTVVVNEPTPLDELEVALRESAITAQDVVYDLGCGDGRACVLAAVEFGARTVGLDTRPAAIELAQANARRNGVAHLCRFYAADSERADISAATVAYVYRRPAEVAMIASRLDRLPKLRLAISYRHNWPARGVARGRFWLWNRIKLDAAASDSTAASDATKAKSAVTPNATSTGRFLPRWLPSCRGGDCKSCR